jgi:hypothetical protein
MLLYQIGTANNSGAILEQLNAVPVGMFLRWGAVDSMGPHYRLSGSSLALNIASSVHFGVIGLSDRGPQPQRFRSIAGSRLQARHRDARDRRYRAHLRGLKSRWVGD